MLKLKKKSAAGPDSLPPILFNQCASSLSFPLSILFRSLIDLHELPSEWKISIITPKFKKGNPSAPQNYRPISLTCTCCKVLETIIANKLLEFLSKSNLLSKSQHGFLKRHSTTTNLLESTKDWTISLTNRKSVVVGYIDFQRAFDTISHPKLLLKLASYGICGNLFLWIKSFISNRHQCVRINSYLSPTLEILSGVPQGSVLGPILFNLFVNDLPDNFEHNVKVKLFADDLKIYSEINSVQDNINFQNHLNVIFEWSVIWQMKISFSKCNIMEYGSYSPQNIFYFSLTPITHSTTIRDLGILFDHNLKFSQHIHDVIVRSKQRSALIFRSYQSRDTTNLLLEDKTYIRPIAEYASTIWSPSLITLINDMESIQKISLNVSRVSRIFPILRDC